MDVLKCSATVLKKIGLDISVTDVLSPFFLTLSCSCFRKNWNLTKNDISRHLCKYTHFKFQYQGIGNGIMEGWCGRWLSCLYLH